MTHTNPSPEVQGDCLDIPDRRIQERQPKSLQLGLILLAVQNQPEIKIKVRDISTSGMGFRSRRVFGEGDYVALRMPGTSGQQRLILCQIKHCRDSEDGAYAIGAEFMESISVPAGAAAPSQWMELN